MLYVNILKFFTKQFFIKRF